MDMWAYRQDACTSRALRVPCAGTCKLLGPQLLRYCMANSSPRFSHLKIVKQAPDKIPPHVDVVMPHRLVHLAAGRWPGQMQQVASIVNEVGCLDSSVLCSTQMQQ